MRQVGAYSQVHSLTGQATWPQHFVSTENDARALIAEERSLLDS